MLNAFLGFCLLSFFASSGIFLYVCLLIYNNVAAFWCVLSSLLNDFITSYVNSLKLKLSHIENFNDTAWALLWAAANVFKTALEREMDSRVVKDVDRNFNHSSHLSCLSSKMKAHTFKASDYWLLLSLAHKFPFFDIFRRNHRLIVRFSVGPSSSAVWSKISPIRSDRLNLAEPGRKKVEDKELDEGPQAEP